MTDPALTNVPVLTDVVQLRNEADLALQNLLVQALPGLVQQAMRDVQPQLEQHLLDALMPRLMAALAQGQTNETRHAADGGPRLP